MRGDPYHRSCETGTDGHRATAARATWRLGGGSVIGPLTTQVGSACRQLLEELPDGAVRAVVAETLRGLDEPLRVAIVGRVNTGKSTLVNALLGQRVAPTDVSECTRYVTWYRYGVPERVEVVTIDGTTRAFALTNRGAMPLDIALDDDTSHLQVFLANDALRDLVIVDTPGLASANDARSAQTLNFLALDVRSRLAASQVDAVIFLLTSSLGADEASTLEDLRALFTSLGASAVNTVGLLSKADKLAGDGPGAIAAAYADRLRGSVATVVPVVGLLAETANCGVLTDASVSALRSLAMLDDTTRMRLTLSADRFVNATTEVPPDVRSDLLACLDLYGLERAFEVFGADLATGPGRFVDMLREESGIDEVQDVIGARLAANADAIKAAGALAGIERAAYAPGSALDARMLGLVVDAVEAVSTAPGMHRLAEMRVLQEWGSGRLSLPEHLRDDLLRVTSPGSVVERVGLVNEAGTAEVQRAALEGVARWKRFGNEAGSSTTEQWAADIVSRSYEQLWLSTTRDVAG
jgi:hypothetical protein